MLYRLLLVVTAFAFSAPGVARSEWTEWIADTKLGFQYNDNVNQTAFNSEEKSDFIFIPEASLGRAYQLGDNTRLTATLDLKGEVYASYDRLDSLTIAATLAAHHKFGLGPRVPWARAHVSGGHYNLHEDVRDSWLFETGIEVGKRLSDRLDGTLSVLYTNRNGKNGPLGRAGFGRDVYDQKAITVGLGGNYLLTDRLVASLKLDWREGDFDSTCPSSGVGAVLANESPKAVTLDKVFGNPLTGCIYRLDGDIYSGSLSFNYALTPQVALDAGFRFKHGEARRLDYQSSIATLSVSYRY